MKNHLLSSDGFVLEMKHVMIRMSFLINPLHVINPLINPLSVLVNLLNLPFKLMTDM